MARRAIERILDAFALVFGTWLGLVVAGATAGLVAGLFTSALVWFAFTLLQELVLRGTPMVVNGVDLKAGWALIVGGIVFCKVLVAFATVGGLFGK